jgi:hypothetical protein
VKVADQLPDWGQLLAAAARLQKILPGAADWRPVLARVRRDPDGPVAARLAELLGSRDYEESGALWRAFLDQARARRTTAGGTRVATD